MTTAPYVGIARAEWRAVCDRHQIKSEIQPGQDAAALLAADTRSFCPVCYDEAEKAKARLNGGRWAGAHEVVG